MIDNILLVTTATFVAMIAGLFFSFSTSINPATHRLGDAEFVRVWQHINRFILNPVFLLAFNAPMILLPIITFMNWGEGLYSTLLLGATIAYLVGPIAITFGGNIPLNNQLDKFNLDNASDTEITEARRKFEAPWMKLHRPRMLLTLLSVILLFCAFLAE